MLNTGKAAANHGHSYLPLTGGTVAGAITASSFTGPLSGNATTATTATNADKLDGYHGSASQAVNTYVLRNSSGYTFHNYINSNTSNNENPAISQVIVTNGSDNYYRKASLAHLKSQMGLGNYDSVHVDQNIFFGFNDTFMNGINIIAGGDFSIDSEKGNVGVCTGAFYVHNRSGTGWAMVYASSFSNQSTRTSKENFSAITEEEALNLLKIPPQHFDYIKGEKNQSGFIAEDVEPFFPEICSYQKDEKTGEKKLFGLDYSKFSPYIIKLLQVQEERIERLEGQFKKEKIT